MAGKLYEVLDGCAYTGKHRVYYGGDQFPESEIFGDITVALKGQKEKKDLMERNGKEIEVVTMMGKEPVLKVAETDKKKVKK